MKKRTKDKLFYFLGLLLFLGFVFSLTFLLGKNLKPFFQDLQEIKKIVAQFKLAAPLIFILIVSLQVIIAPIPGQTIGLASGLLFGPIIGTIYCLFGLVIGSLLAFLIAKKLGRPFVEKLFKKETIEKIDKKFLKYGLFPLFLIYLLPAFPDDAICFVAGLSKIKTRDFIFISTIGRMPGFLVLNLIGAGLISKENQKIAFLAFIILCLISFVFYLKKDKIEKLIFKD